MKINENLFIWPLLLLLLLLIAVSSCEEDFSNIVIPSVTTGFVSQITDTSAMVEGNSNTSGGDHIVARGICWSNLLTQPNTNPDDWYNGGWGSGSFSGYMDGLTPGLTYYVQAFSSNSAGGAAGNVILFSTTGNITGESMFNPDLTYGTVTDIQGNTYKTIQIGSQTWMAENLKATKYSDGIDIPEVTGLNAWIDLQTPGYCWYVNDPKFKNPYGALYNWYAVNTEKICPAGWHVPTDGEWLMLTSNLGDESQAGVQLREAGASHWVFENQETNSTGFTALPGGYRSWNDQKYFHEMGYAAGFWSSTADPYDADLFAVSRRFYFRSDSGGIFYNINSKKTGLSVRCVKDQ